MMTPQNSAPSDLSSMEALYRTHMHAARLDELATSGMDVVLGERRGAQFFDLRRGEWLWNCHSNGGTFNLGHRNPEVIAAVAAAMDQVDIGNHHLPSPRRVEAASRLAATTAGALPGVVFSSSGTEANELAMKIARLHNGRRGVVVVDGCYHGTGFKTMAANVPMSSRLGFGDEDYRSVPWNDLPAMEAVLDDSVGLVMLEAIPATSGFPMPDPGYLAGVAAAARKAGALLLIDEVQTGLGRTGAMWSHEWDGITPDLIVTGKGLSGGIYPIAATLLSPDLFATWSAAPRIHVSTFGGSEIGCAAVVATLDILESPGLMDHVRTVSDFFGEAFADAPFELRRRGLVMAIATDDPEGHWSTWRKLRDQGVYGMPAAFDPRVVQFKPPLTLQLDEAEQVAAAVRHALG